MSHNPVNRH